MTYTFLLFDLDHTLLDFDTAEEVALTQFLQDQGVQEIQGFGRIWSKRRLVKKI